MPEFRVVSVLDGDTFDVSPQWQWNSQTGARVRHDQPKTTPRIHKALWDIAGRAKR
jgi:hypothetical protein